MSFYGRLSVILKRFIHRKRTIVLKGLCKDPSDFDGFSSNYIFELFLMLALLFSFSDFELFPFNEEFEELLHG